MERVRLTPVLVPRSILPHRGTLPPLVGDPTALLDPLEHCITTEECRVVQDHPVERVSRALALPADEEA